MQTGLALCRIGLGIAVIYEGLVWIFNEQRINLIMEYPSSAVISSSRTNFSLFHMNTSYYFYAIVFLVQIFSGICLAFGYKTKKANIILAIILTSLYRRFPICIDRGDNLLLILLFWGYFTNWHEILSIDKLLELQNIKIQKKQFNISKTIALFCMLIQISISHFRFATSLLNSNSIYNGIGIIHLQ